MKGDHIQCYYDGKKYLDVKDSTFREAGKIGLWTKADGQSHFDDLTVSGYQTVTQRIEDRQRRSAFRVSGRKLRMELPFPIMDNVKKFMKNRPGEYGRTTETLPLEGGGKALHHVGCRTALNLTWFRGWG